MKVSPLTYAVGDIHGCADLLRRALGAIRAHARGRDHTIVFLGDYIDRGPGSKEVLEILLSLRAAGPVVCLRGNHEEMMLRAYREGAANLLNQWLDVGGRETLKSYSRDGAAHFGCVPERHWRWLAQRPLLLEDAGHIFVHAGIEPKKSLMEQGEREFLWIRKRFLTSSPGDFVDRRHVVHGHTPTWAGKPDAALPEMLANRTNLDTGAYVTGVLSIGVFDVERSRGPVDLLSAR